MVGIPNKVPLILETLNPRPYAQYEPIYPPVTPFKVPLSLGDPQITPGPASLNPKPYT